VNGFLTYWIIGCVLIGLGLGKHQQKCPDYKPPLTANEIVAVIAVWPAHAIAAWFVKDQPNECTGEKR
jgi:hypothetical protein